MKNKIFCLILLALLSQPIDVWAVDNNVISEDNGIVQEQIVTDTSDSIPETEVVAEEEPATPTPQPTHREKLVRKFLAAMLGVVASSIILYVGLSIYNKIRENIVNEVKTPEGETSLETPDDLSSAVRTFLEKTDWQG